MKLVRGDATIECRVCRCWVAISAMNTKQGICYRCLLSKRQP